MVKHPKYEAMDGARESEIPIAFKLYATKEYQIKEFEPKIPSEPLLGPIPRSFFHILNKNGKLSAQFYPNGYSECYDENFRPIYEKMVREIENAAQRAYQDYIKLESDY